MKTTPRIRDRAPDLAAEVRRFFEVDGEGVQHHRERAGELPRPHHRDEEAVEDVRVQGQRVGEARPRGDRVAHAREDLAELLVGGLRRQRGEDAHEVEAAAQHGRELSGEEDDGGQPHPARQAPEGGAEGLAEGERGGAAEGPLSGGGTDGEHEAPLLAEAVDEVPRVLRLLAAARERARAVRHLVLEHGHRPTPGPPRPPGSPRSSCAPGRPGGIPPVGASPCRLRSRGGEGYRRRRRRAPCAGRRH
jgi:hypothetical protein